jgi:hypothetical protein
VNRRWPLGAVYLLVVILATPVVIGLLVASIGGGAREAFVGHWIASGVSSAAGDSGGPSLDRDHTLTITEDEGRYTVRFDDATTGEQLVVPAVARAADVLAGVVPPGTPAGVAGLPEETSAGATITVQVLDDDRSLTGSVSPVDGGLYVDLGVYQRYGYFTDPLVRAAFVIVGVIVGIGLLLAMIIPMVTRAGDDARPGRRETAVRGLVIVATVVGVAVLMLGDPLLGWIALVVVLPAWFFFLLRWWRREWLETYEAVGRCFSSKKRHEFRAAETERPA